jgi:hypothetical protein
VLSRWASFTRVAGYNLRYFTVTASILRVVSRWHTTYICTRGVMILPPTRTGDGEMVKSRRCSLTGTLLDSQARVDGITADEDAAG